MPVATGKNTMGTPRTRSPKGVRKTSLINAYSFASCPVHASSAMAEKVQPTALMGRWATIRLTTKTASIDQANQAQRLTIGLPRLIRCRIAVRELGVVLRQNRPEIVTNSATKASMAGAAVPPVHPSRCRKWNLDDTARFCARRLLAGHGAGPSGRES